MLRRSMRLCNSKSNSNSNGNASHAACRSLDMFSEIFQKDIQHVHFGHSRNVSGFEKKVSGGTLMQVDGWIKEDKIVFEYFGNEYHGFPPSVSEYERSRRSSIIRSKTYSELYDDSMKRLSKIQKIHPDWKIYIIWEHEMNHMLAVKSNPLNILSLY